MCGSIWLRKQVPTLDGFIHKQRSYRHLNATKHVFQRHCNRTSDRFNPYAHQCCACDSRNYCRVTVRIFTLRPMEVLHGKFMWGIIIYNIRYEDRKGQKSDSEVIPLNSIISRNSSIKYWIMSTFIMLRYCFFMMYVWFLNHQNCHVSCVVVFLDAQLLKNEQNSGQDRYQYLYATRKEGTVTAPVMWHFLSGLWRFWLVLHCWIRTTRVCCDAVYLKETVAELGYAYV